MEKMMLFLFVMTPIAGLAINAAIQIAIARFLPGTGLLRSIYFGFFSGLGGMIIIQLLYWTSCSFLFRDMLPPNIANIAGYMVLGYCYFHFVGLSETARRIRLLAEIYASADGLSLEEMLARYNAREIVEKRIDRLLNNGQLGFKDGKYFIGRPVVLLIAGGAILSKLLFLGRRHELNRKAV